MAVASGRRRTRRRRSEPTTRASKVMTLPARRAPLASLAPAVQGEVRGDAGTVVTDVVLDTRKVVPGALFCCVPGARVDGHDRAAQALDAGAAALCVQRPLDLDAPQLLVGGVRDVLARLAVAFFDDPSRRLDLVGVTGTNGKTTTTFMLESIFRAAGRTPGVVGTVEVRVGDQRRPAVHTTPQPPDLQRLLAEMVDAGVRAAAMEVSSHGLALHRVDGTRFKAALFTNLTQDPLDFHAGLDDYFQAKRRLFTGRFTPLGVVNVDDPHGRVLAGTAEVAVVTTGTAADADWRATEVAASLEGTSFRLRSPAGTSPVRLRLAGQFNVGNPPAPLAAADALGIGLEAAVAGLEALAGVPGRFERVDAGQPFTVLVDYAHTPDSLDNLLRAARAVTGGGGIGGFCWGGAPQPAHGRARGGDRDRAKRPRMGEIAGGLADVAVVPSDNPRSEAPEAIVAQVAEGVAQCPPPGGFLVEVDRRAAIRAALAMAGPGDAVLLAGKGHEQGQE